MSLVPKYTFFAILCSMVWSEPVFSGEKVVSHKYVQDPVFKHLACGKREKTKKKGPENRVCVPLNCIKPPSAVLEEAIKKGTYVEANKEGLVAGQNDYCVTDKGLGIGKGAGGCAKALKEACVQVMTPKKADKGLDFAEDNPRYRMDKTCKEGKEKGTKGKKMPHVQPVMFRLDSSEEVWKNKTEIEKDPPKDAEESEGWDQAIIDCRKIVGNEAVGIPGMKVKAIQEKYKRICKKEKKARRAQNGFFNLSISVQYRCSVEKDSVDPDAPPQPNSDTNGYHPSSDG